MRNSKLLPVFKLVQVQPFSVAKLKPDSVHLTGDIQAIIALVDEEQNVIKGSLRPKYFKIGLQVGNDMRIDTIQASFLNFESQFGYE